MRNGSRKYQKGFRFSVNVEDFYDSAKHQKPLVKQRFGASTKVSENTLYNLAFTATFGALFAKRDPKVSRNHWDSQEKLMAFYDTVKHKKTLVKQLFGACRQVNGNTL